MPKNIAAVGLSLPGDATTFIPLKSKTSLLDYDIIILDPNISEFDDHYQEYQGKSCLSDTNSFALREHSEHWKREISEAIKAGKSVFVLLNELEEVYIATGDHRYSGTGRNRHTTRIVTGHSNYAMIPGALSVVDSRGTAMRLAPKAEVIAGYWSAVEDSSGYRVQVSGDSLHPLILTKSGEKLVGALRRYKGTSGALVLLPYVDFSLEEFTETKKDGEYWTGAADQLAAKLISSIVAVDSAIKESTESTPAPIWVVDEQYVLPKEQALQTKLLQLETEVQRIRKDIETHQQYLSEHTALKVLLYEKGKPLESSIIEALRILGFAASPFRSADSEFDVVFECPEGRLIGEAEGKDNKPINIDKLRQLEMNLHEDFDREEITAIAKGVLFGNAFRLSPPESRDAFFTQKCLQAAARSGVALVRTVDLFSVVRHALTVDDEAFKRSCRQAILTATGVVQFPPVSAQPPAQATENSVSEASVEDGAQHL